MKKFTRPLLFTLITLFSFFAVVTGTFSWFINSLQMNIINLEGTSAGAYFAYGNGTSANPYGIRLPRHLYNLSWLQYCGFFNKDKDGNKVIDKQFYFELADDIDMDGWEIPPIGTERYPFVGNFNGQGHVISNVTISNKSSFSQKPIGITYDVIPEIVGLFGVVGKIDTLPYSYSTSVNQINNFVIDTITVESRTSETLIGLAAGYVNGTMQGVKVKGDATLDVNGQTSTALSDITENLSDYGLVGYSTKIGSGGNNYSQKLSEYYANGEDSGGGGDDDDWGGSFNSKTYTNLLYNLNHSTTSETTTTVSGDGGYVVKKTASTTQNPNNPTGHYAIYRLRDGSYVPLKFSDDTNSRASLNNTGYLVGSNIGTSATNASPKVSSYKMVNIQNAITNTQSTNMADTSKATNISYVDSKLEVLTYQDGWKRIRDSHNASNNSTNRAITSYTKTDLANFGFKKYEDSRNSLQTVLESSPFIHGIHFDNNIISTSNLLTVPANIIRVGGNRISTTYQLPKGSINFNLKERGIINFFAGTYNTSNITLNMFSLYKVTRSANGNITALDEIKKIYSSTSGDDYVYQHGNTKPSGADALLFDLDTVLKGTAPVINMMYYFELPVNAGEYAMGMVNGGSASQGAYMIYLDIGTNGDTPEVDEISGYSITTIASDNSFPIGIDFAPVTVTGNGGESIGIIIPSSGKGVVVLSVSNKQIAISDSSSITTYSFQGSKYTDSSPGNNEFNVTGDEPLDPESVSEFGTRVLNIHLALLNEDVYDVRITDILTDDSGSYSESSSTYELDSGSGFAPSTKSAIEALSTDLDLDLLRGLTIAVTLTRSAGNGAFTTAYDVANCSYNEKTIDVDIETSGSTISIGVEDDYTFKIGGTTYPDGSTYS